MSNMYGNWCFIWVSVINHVQYEVSIGLGWKSWAYEWNSRENLAKKCCRLIWFESWGYTMNFDSNLSLLVASAWFDSKHRLYLIWITKLNFVQNIVFIITRVSWLRLRRGLCTGKFMTTALLVNSMSIK